MINDTTPEDRRARKHERAVEDRAALKRLREAVDETERAFKAFHAVWKRKPVR